MTVCGPLSSSTVWLARRETRRIIDRIDRDGERLRCTGVDYSVPRPSSESVMVIVAVPFAPAAGVYVKHPCWTDGWSGTEERGIGIAVTLKVSVCLSPSPSLIAVAHPLTVCAPASSFDRLIRSLGETRRTVDRFDRHRARRRRTIDRSIIPHKGDSPSRGIGILRGVVIRHRA